MIAIPLAITEQAPCWCSQWTTTACTGLAGGLPAAWAKGCLNSRSSICPLSCLLIYFTRLLVQLYLLPTASYRALRSLNQQRLVWRSGLGCSGSRSAPRDTSGGALPRRRAKMGWHSLQLSVSRRQLFTAKARTTTYEKTQILQWPSSPQ